MRSRALHLAKETLAPLGAADLDRVVGGNISIPNTACMPATFQFDCLNDNTFEQCPQPRTLPLEECV